MTALLVLICAGATAWQHPAGLLTSETVSELRDKLATQAWARETYEARKRALEPWRSVSFDELKAVFPTKRGNVYHNFSCPADRTRLKFDPFNPKVFHCDTCGKDYTPETDAGIYTPDDVYHGTMYDGWACLFYLTAPAVAMDLALVGRIDRDEAATKRGVELLSLFATTIQGLPTLHAREGDKACILTYHREGDNKVLNELARAYELLRESMTPEERKHIEEAVLKRMLDDIMLQPAYTFDHNNIYQFHRTVLQVACALERDDLIDWSCGYGAYAPEALPEHRSLQRIVATHFKPDGAFWELCSGYHLYPMDPFCEIAVLSHNLSRMDSDRFPAERYDFSNPASPVGKTIKAALEWFVSMAMPDRTMPVLGDSMAPRAGMDSYATTAEVGYRYFDIRAVGDYAVLREGKRTWVGFLFGAPQIVRQPTPFTSSYLSSGYVALRNEWEGNRLWVGLNALIPGGGHQHADRLTLTLYSQDKLLALEKATPYNDAAMRELGTLTLSHTTVTVDRTSQKQGEALKDGEIPEVALFASGPFLKFAELRDDHLYPQTSVYRRSVAVIEDLVIDVFRVEGGTTHDWMVHHAGPAPELSIPVEDAAFEPADWIAHGTGRVKRAVPGGDWNARWRVDDVGSRLTMIASNATQVFALETYPVDNAIVTPDHPPCQSLCVRRTDNAPFIAVWDAWRGAPNLQSVERVPGKEALLLATRAHRYHVLLAPGAVEFPDGVTINSDASFGILRDRDAIAYAGGTELSVQCSEGNITARLNEKGNAWADWSGGTLTRAASPGIEYDTYCGEDHPRDTSAIVLSMEGSLPPPAR